MEKFKNIIAIIFGFACGVFCYSGAINLIGDRFTVIIAPVCLAVIYCCGNWMAGILSKDDKK